MALPVPRPCRAVRRNGTTDRKAVDIVRLKRGLKQMKEKGNCCDREVSKGLQDEAPNEIAQKFLRALLAFELRQPKAGRGGSGLRSQRYEIP